MFYWIYEIITIAAVGLFAAVFVGVCWLGVRGRRLYRQARRGDVAVADASRLATILAAMRQASQ
jgi:hypothetical protein